MRLIWKLLTFLGIVFCLLIGFISIFLIYSAPQLFQWLRLTGQATLPTGFSFQGTELGGYQELPTIRSKRFITRSLMTAAKRLPSVLQLKLDLTQAR